ncbi:carboxylesterase family protein [Streptomyces sp. SID4919]|uniref:carboxylesterase/lipase family protein n=1 Tax=unclassified Streptomyces TaxID=2593676 RepID=UPI000823D390|nr:MULTISPECIES: carboxylesterase family protein [unclassified Streptomyces]MYY09702.1 carboxylesterase family protein [Streptomyces sp. SID4919]SCK35655.1 para-nitrobenzyl esterase [Streptomyces sp. AmelKG-E11A]
MSQDPSPPRTVTPSGPVRGTLENGVAVFRGIPYAQAPVGALRLRAPEPVAPWDGVLVADRFGPTAPKVPYAPPMDALLPDPEVPGDGCLNLNVWAPWEPGEGQAPGPGRPVMVWVHGGSLVRGSSAVPVYDGTAFARDGVVLVSLNYRLGIEGFGVFPDAPANLGLLDQIAALRWVRDCVAAFGGDPERVTVFGESAGAISVAALLTAPAARGLFRRAVVQSGAPIALPLARARATTEAVARRLGVPATVAALAGVDRDRLLAAQTEVTGKGTPLTGGHSFQPAVDGDLLPRDPAVALAEGASAEVEVLMGTNTEEYRLWFVPGGLTERVGRFTLRLALWKTRTPARILRAYRAGRPGALPGELLGALAADKLLLVPQTRLADARRAGPARTFVYEFGWPSPVRGLGACHALELGFVFDTLGRPGTDALTGPDAPQELADAMHAAWVRFAATGDPGWRAWDGSRPIMTFGPDAPALVEGVRADELSAWD